MPVQQLRGLCIDANPQMVRDTTWQLQANGLGQVHAVWGLVGAAGAGAKSAFYVNPDAAGSSQFDRTPTGHLSTQGLERIEVPVTCRLDSDEEVLIYQAGGVLQRFAQDFLESSKAA